MVADDIALLRQKHSKYIYKYIPGPRTRRQWKCLTKCTTSQQVPDSSDSGDTDANLGSQDESLGNQGEQAGSQGEQAGSQGEQAVNQEEIPDDGYVESTLPICSLTLSYRFESDLQELEELENVDPPPYHVKQGQILPPDLTSSNSAFVSTSTSSSPRRRGPESSRARIVDHDAPTQLVDANDVLSENTQAYGSEFAEAPTLPYIYEDSSTASPTSPVVQESHQRVFSSTSVSRRVTGRVQEVEPTQIIHQETQETQIIYQETQIIHQETQETQLINQETQLIHEEGVASSGSSLDHARQTSVEPESQEVSQIVSGSPPEQNHDDEDRVPATPAELIDAPPTASRDGFQSVDIRTSVVEEVDLVSATPEERRYTAMSEISAFETQGELSDESASSLTGTAPTRDNNSLAKQKQGDTNAHSEGTSQTATPTRWTKSDNRDPNEDDMGERPSWRHRQTVRLNKKEIRESSLSSFTNTEESFSKGTGTADTTREISAGPPSQMSPPKSKEGSPKHNRDSDTEGSPPKPAKLIKTDSVEEDTKRRPRRKSSASEDTTTPPFRRASSSRTLTRRTTSDLDLQRPAVMISTPGMEKSQVRMPPHRIVPLLLNCITSSYVHSR